MPEVGAAILRLWTLGFFAVIMRHFAEVLWQLGSNPVESKGSRMQGCSAFAVMLFCLYFHEEIS